jgi:hypothetical protein
MIDIPIDQVPELTGTDIEHDAKFGVFEDGVLIHYVMKDIARLVTWEDIILLGIGEGMLHKCNNTDGSEIREIPKPVVP